MAGIDMITLNAAKKYVDETADQFGALKGAACQFDGSEVFADNFALNFLWENSAGEQRTGSAEIPFKVEVASNTEEEYVLKFTIGGSVITTPNLRGSKADPYTGTYSVTPTHAEQTLPTSGYNMEDDVTVKAIPVSEVSNEAGGKTVTF